MSSKLIQMGDVKFLAVDLTQPLSLDVNEYPGTPKPERSVFARIGVEGHEFYTHLLGDHVSHPHADAPKHQNADLKDKGMEVFDISFWYNRACLIDLSETEEAEDHNKNGVKYVMAVQTRHLGPINPHLEKRGAVVIRTGYDRHTEQNKVPDKNTLPYLTEEVARFLSAFPNIKVVGIDSLTVDPFGKHGAHQALKDKMIIESLVNLHEIPPQNCIDFMLQTTPIIIEGATGGPVVACAYIPQYS